jgi:pSer/pThr/pTyr-binding forkhead associated (FHA) protein
MAAVIYRCPVDASCPTAAEPSFCGRHPTAVMKPSRAAFAPPVDAGTGSDAPDEGQDRTAPQRRTAADGLLAVRILGTSVTIPPEGMELGRESPLLLNLPGLSELDQVGRHHAWLQYQGSELTVLDLGSVNGTYIDGRRTKGPETVRPDQRLRLALDVEVGIEHVQLDPYGLLD